MGCLWPTNWLVTQWGTLVCAEHSTSLCNMFLVICNFQVAFGCYKVLRDSYHATSIYASHQLNKLWTRELWRTIYPIQFFVYQYWVQALHSDQRNILYRVSGCTLVTTKRAPVSKGWLCDTDVICNTIIMGSPCLSTTNTTYLANITFRILVLQDIMVPKHLFDWSCSD